MKIKSIFLAMVAMLATIAVRAQSYVVSPEHFFGTEYSQIGMRNIMELRDGGILANVQLFKRTSPYDYGRVFYKIVYDSVSVHVSDTLFVEDHDMNYFLLERNPFDNDNVFAKIICNSTDVRSDLRIQFFDDNLNFKPEKEIWVPVSDTLISPLDDYYMLDDNGDLLFYYKIQSRKEFHVVKMSLDGTEKAHLVMPTDNDMINNDFIISTFNESPKEYCLMGLYSPPEIDPYYVSGVDSLRFIILDSILNIERTITHNTPPLYRKFNYGWDSFQTLEDTSFLLLTKYDTVPCPFDNDTCYGPINHEHVFGTCLSKCGKSNGRNYASRLYSVFSYPMDVKKTNDGNVYIAFYNTASVTVAKLTQNMEVLWETNYNNGAQYFTNIVALESGGVAVGGLNIYFSEDYSSYTQGLFFVIFKDENFSVTENKAEERPYTLYPNPVNDELSLNIAHGAEVSLMELYDIQGRMVRSKKSGFETISLQGLPAGTYALRVSLKNGKIFTSTVIKK